MDLSDFGIVEHSFEEKGTIGSAFFQSKDGAMAIGFSGVLTEEKSNALDFRNFLWNNAKNDKTMKVSEMKMEDSGAMKMLEYIIDQKEGKMTHDKITNAVLSVPNGVTSVLIIKVNYTKADDMAINKLIKSIKLKKPYTPNSLDNAFFGSYFFDQNEYAKAIKFLNKAITLEKRKPSLEKNIWRIVVDNLGMSYGITKKYSLAQKTYDYALAIDPEYPMFFYNLACLNAEMAKPDKALEYLGKTYEFRANMIPGEKFRDIRKDSSFVSLLKNPKFEELAKQFDKIRK